MSYPTRFLKSTNPPTDRNPATTNDETAVDSDFVVILAALLCALICVLGLVAVARCAWIRRFTSGGGGVRGVVYGGRSATNAPANKGLKKKVLKSLPKFIYNPETHAPKLFDCPICLAEFATGDEIRVLPQCGHGFHVVCIDTWLGSHSSCPFCRQILVVATRCQKCGGLPVNTSSSSANSGGGCTATSNGNGGNAGDVIDLEAGRMNSEPSGEQQPEQPQPEQQQQGCVNSFLP